MLALFINSEKIKQESHEQLPGQESDEQLIRWVAAGEPAYLGALFERHHVSLYQFCLQLTRNRSLSEDLVQDVFMKILKKAKSFRGEGSVKAWMFNIARNTTFDLLRKNKYRAGSEFENSREEPIDVQSTEQVITHGQTLKQVTQALSSLPESTREIIWLGRFVFDNYQDLGQALDCKASTARVRMHRAMQQLNDAFVQLHGAPFDA